MKTVKFYLLWNLLLIIPKSNNLLTNQFLEKNISTLALKNIQNHKLHLDMARPDNTFVLSKIHRQCQQYRGIPQE